MTISRGPFSARTLVDSLTLVILPFMLGAAFHTFGRVWQGLCLAVLAALARSLYMRLTAGDME